MELIVKQDPCRLDAPVISGTVGPSIPWMMSAYPGPGSRSWSGRSRDLENRGASA